MNRFTNSAYHQAKIYISLIQCSLTSLSLSLSVSLSLSLSLFLSLSSTASMATHLVSMVTKQPGIRSCQGGAGLLTSDPTGNDFLLCCGPRVLACKRAALLSSRPARVDRARADRDWRVSCRDAGCLGAHHFPDRWHERLSCLWQNASRAPPPPLHTT